MKTVNYFILGEILNLLERIQLIHGVAFDQFDPDDESDVKTIVNKYIKPTVESSSRESQAAMCTAIAYYTTTGTAPVQLMRDRCQELTLPDADSWDRFFDRIGELLFGTNFKLGIDPTDIVELPDEKECETFFRQHS